MFKTTMRARLLAGLGAVGAASTNAFAITSADVPTTTIISDIGVVFVALLAVALAVFGVKAVVKMF